mmetsp:Transcript_26859/g.25911  ORF Transcript_26859/g.25911 Transcript_26859/m.25911 type:complete len:119 (-) Transcript_26859:13-369(-)|eukprot:CAMPEP_0170547868 /NCGR_PEP_ID=MMETSP0211-20121228/6177_1 /TAXON_ID=311385 /ORGANISM="Pseudokeronopsis sp., Strain OXSARD2" /LENGTH=118 /DNA_ID=CAMNT_0010853071 /DNA_START=1374 /DNA_END=1730 /DNA_ORIENTATION=-
MAPEDQLWMAAENGQMDPLQHLLSNNLVDPNITNQNDEGWTALHYASNEGHDQIVECLLRTFNAEVDIKSSNGRTPLHVACNRMNKKVIERLLLAGADANMKQRSDGNTPIHIVAKYA